MPHTGGSTVTGNHTEGGGGGVFNLGDVTLNGSAAITDNTPDNCAPPGSVPGCVNP